MSAGWTVFKKDVRLAGVVLLPAAAIIGTLWLAVSIGHLVPGGGEVLWGSPNHLPGYTERLGNLLPVLGIACAVVPMCVAVVLRLGDARHRASALAASVPVEGVIKIASKLSVGLACVLGMLALYVAALVVMWVTGDSVHGDPSPWSAAMAVWMLCLASCAGLCAGLAAAFLVRRIDLAMVVGVALAVVGLALAFSCAVAVVAYVLPNSQEPLYRTSGHYPSEFDWDVVARANQGAEYARLFATLAGASALLLVLALRGVPELAGVDARIRRVPWLGLALAACVVVSAATAFLVLSNTRAVQVQVDYEQVMAAEGRDAASATDDVVVRMALGDGTGQTDENAMSGSSGVQVSVWIANKTTGGVMGGWAHDPTVAIRQGVWMRELWRRRPAKLVPGLPTSSQLALASLRGPMIMFECVLQVLNGDPNEWDRAVVTAFLATNYRRGDCSSQALGARDAHWCHMRSVGICELRQLASDLGELKSERYLRALNQLGKPLPIVAEAMQRRGIELGQSESVTRNELDCLREDMRRGEDAR